MYEVLLSVPITNMTEWRLINKIAELVDPNMSGGGTGFGYRDLDWVKDDRKQAAYLAKKLTDAFDQIKGTKIRVKKYRQ